MKRALLICGLVRDPERFGAYLEGLLQMARGDLRVIFSSWDGERARYPVIAALLGELGCEICEQAQPDLKLPGHMLHQTMTLELGLSLLDDDVFVLKVRPDNCGLVDVEEFLALVPQVAPPGRLTRPFGHRVHLVGMFGAHPLYINDVVFAGMAGDLRKLCWLPFIYGLKYPRLAPEQWLWATPLAAGNPVLDGFLSVNPGLIFDDPLRNAALRAVLTASPLFARAVAVTAILTRDCLAYFHPDPQIAETVSACAGVTLDAMLWDRVAIPGIDHHPTAQTNTFLSAGLMHAVHDGIHAPSLFGDRVQQAMAHYGEPGGAKALQMDRATIAEEATTLAQDVASLVGIGGDQAIRSMDRLHLVQRGAAPWAMADTGAAYAKALEDEVNHLRRVVDQLQTRLG